MYSEIVCQAAINWMAEVFQGKLSESDENNPFIIGIGSGSTIIPFIKLLCDFIKSKQFCNRIVCIPTSTQARFLILDNLKCKCFRLGTLDEFNVIDFTVDGADAVYFNEKFIVKGGGAAHCQEKIVAEASKSYIIVVADHKKIEKPFETVSIPIEIIPLAYRSLMRLLKEEFGSDLISLNLRNCPVGSGKIGPIITDNGNLNLDLKFSAKLSKNPQLLDQRLRQFAGVIETGIFWRLPKKSLMIFQENDQNHVNTKLLIN